MPRQARLDAPGALHHIMVRGINRAHIFADGADKARFLERLGQNVSAYLRDVVDSVDSRTLHSGSHSMTTWAGPLVPPRHFVMCFGRCP